MKTDLASLLGTDDDAPPTDDKPSIGDALGETPDEPTSGTDVTTEAKKETGQKLLDAFKAGDPMAMFDAVSSVISLAGD